ncbi:DUF6542 domain-containing protein [Streptomyces sp. S.PNR 29]|uniref:DUF6542 domain-containing protein n=1 Tax=Streptomyces sp. S.PNR 29 TaxID=2973805 RepID=UPI0025B191DE|nr:DUF6542 domain-containing protein [Streptomyces sp. S.PNR 29]MDN0195510.1 hypothetical protein [Streptomyces sp. S.PNR 29]
MEQHRTRPPQYGPRRGRPPLPPQAVRGSGGGAPKRGAGGAPTARPLAARPQGAAARGGVRRRPVAVRQSAPPAVQAVARMPNPRLTGLGSGLFCAAVMCVVGFLDAVLFGGSLPVYGVLFLPVCVLTSLWVRRGDLLTAPVVVPIAFAVGLLPVAESGGGVGGRLMGLLTALATQAGWLYGGTLVAGSIVIARRIHLIRARATRNRRPG